MKKIIYIALIFVAGLLAFFFFGKQMIKYLSDTYKVKYDKMIVGTTENNIPFYVKQGFDKYLKTVKNFFVDNYDGELFDGDLKCSDMYYYEKFLKK